MQIVEPEEGVMLHFQDYFYTYLTQTNIGTALFPLSRSFHLGNDSYHCTITSQSLLSCVQYDLPLSPLYNTICC